LQRCNRAFFGGKSRLPELFELGQRIVQLTPRRTRTNVDGIAEPHARIVVEQTRADSNNGEPDGNGSS
jgi:hypothetical protein